MAEFLDSKCKALSGVPYGQNKPSGENHAEVEAKKPSSWNASNHKDWTKTHMSDVPLIAEAGKKGNGDADTSFWSKPTSTISQNVSDGKSGTGGVGGSTNKSGLNNHNQSNWK